MKTLLSYLVAGAALLGTAMAAPITFNISHSGFSGGGALTGSFIAEDLNGDGQISVFDGEVIDFTGMFSGDTLVQDVTFDLSSLFGLVYDLGSGFIGDGLLLDFEGIGADTGVFEYLVGQGPFVLCDGSSICGIITQIINGNEVSSTTIQAVMVSDPTSPVPLPGALALFGAGLAIGARTIRRRKA